MRELHQQMSTEECNALKIIAAIVHHQSHSASRSISIKTSNKKAKDQYRIPWSLNWETDNTVAISINDSITLLASAHLLDRIAIHGHRKVRVIHYFSQITMFCKNSCNSRTIALESFHFYALEKLGVNFCYWLNFQSWILSFKTNYTLTRIAWAVKVCLKFPKFSRRTEKDCRLCYCFFFFFKVKRSDFDADFKVR